MKPRSRSFILAVSGLCLVLLCTSCAMSPMLSHTEPPAPSKLYSLPATTLEGTPFDLGTLQGRVSVISNIALGCGTSPQLTELEALYKKYHDQGVMVVAVPRGPSKQAEAGEVHEYRKTCTLRYGVTFPILSIGPIGGPRIHPVLDFVTTSGPQELQGPIDFNFEKFVLDKKGRVRARFGSFSAPAGTAISEVIESLLKEP